MVLEAKQPTSLKILSSEPRRPTFEERVFLIREGENPYNVVGPNCIMEVWKVTRYGRYMKIKYKCTICGATAVYLKSLMPV